MAVNIVRWDDVGAPTLSGTVGAMIPVLDHLLVTVGGWSKVYTGTNKAVYRAPAGNRFYLRVDDAGTATARMVAYESMSDVDTGTNPFPTPAQLSGGVYALKAHTPSASARAWVGAVDDKRFLLWVNTLNDGPSSNTTYGNTTYFGDLKALGAGDLFATLLVGATGSSYSTQNFHAQSTVNNVLNGHYMARIASGIGGSVQCGKNSDAGNAASAIGATGWIYPNPAGGELILSPVRVGESNVLRGTIPGVWAPQHPLASVVNTLDTFTGTGELAGRTFMLLQQYTNSVFALETSDTWDV